VLINMLNSSTKVRAIIAVGLFSFLLGCSRPPGLQEGAFYTVDDGEGFYRVVKILVVDDQGVPIF